MTHPVLISKEEVDGLRKNNKHLHALATRLINEIQVARSANQLFKQENEALCQENHRMRYAMDILEKENDVLRDIRFEYEYARRVQGSFLHESPI